MINFVDIIELEKTYITTHNRVKALDNLSISIKKNEFVSFVGPSGCGKTTLLHLIAGLIKPTNGDIKVNNLTPKKAAKNNYFSYIFQSPSLLPWKTVLENVKLPDKIIGNKFPNKKYEDLLKLMNILEFKKNYPNELSLGMQQRVSIARAMSFNPEILLMDEPFSALDEIMRDELHIELLKVWRKVKRTIIFVTHNLSEAIFLSDRIFILSKRPGKILASVKIEFSRPRKKELKDTKKFYDLQYKIKGLLKN